MIPIPHTGRGWPAGNDLMRLRILPFSHSPSVIKPSQTMRTARHQNGGRCKSYKGETLKIIRGQSKMSIDLLNTMVAETEVQIKEAQAIVDAAEAELQELLETSEGLKREYDRLLSWADLYDKSSFEAKKMIVSQFIRSVRVGRGFNIEVDFNVSFDELQSYSTSNSVHGNMQAPESRTA